MKNFNPVLKNILLLFANIVGTGTMLSAQITNNTADISPTATTVMSDTEFIRKNIADNIIEVQLARLGKQKTTDPQIKTIAQQMINDHGRILNDMRRVARQKNMSGIAAPNNSPIANIANTAAAPAAASGTATITGTEANTPAANAPGATGTGVVSATRTPTGSAAAGMRPTSSGNRALGAGMNAATVTGTATSQTDVSGAGVATIVGTGAGNAGTTANPGNADGAAISGSGALGMGASGNATAGNNTGMSSIQIMQALQNATGANFNTLFVAQMLQMHEEKVLELQTALARITDPILKSAVAKALPVIRVHRDLFARLNGRTGTQSP